MILTATARAAQVVSFRGYLVEVQLHFKAVAALKQFSHVAYNVMRVSATTSLGPMQTLFDFSALWGDSDTAREIDLRCTLRL